MAGGDNHHHHHHHHHDDHDASHPFPWTTAAPPGRRSRPRALSSGNLPDATSALQPCGSAV
jgi:hypothetical protein